MTRDELIQTARDNGWEVTGHRWIRVDRDGDRIEARYVGERLTVIKYLFSTGGHVHMDVVHHRNLPATITGWLNAQKPARTAT